MSDNLQAALQYLSVHYYRFAPCLECNEQSVISVADLCAAVDASIRQSKVLFKLDDNRHAAQLWLFSFVNSVSAPAVTAMVLSDVTINLGLSTGTLFNRDDGAGYWFGFRPSETATSYVAAGRELGISITPLIQALCSATGVRPAPLWAVVADGVIQPAMAAGNEEFEQAKAIRLAHGLYDGLKEVAPVKLPPPRIEQITNSQVLPLVAGEEPEFLLAHRSSCCMIYHSPDAEFCTSCPHQPKEQRLARLIAFAEGY